MIDLGKLCTCGHSERDHDAWDPPYTCGHGMTVEDPDGDCDCMDFDQAAALVSARTVAELQATRDELRRHHEYIRGLTGNEACLICRIRERPDAEAVL
jgi:hypothetical protein